MKDLIKDLKKIISNRMFILFVLMTASFIFIINRLFSLQVIRGDQISKDIRSYMLRTIEIKAARGQIFDRYGRPLAENKIVFELKIDSAGSRLENEALNKILHDFVKLLRQNGEPISDILPISKTEPYTFLLGNNAESEKKWKKNELAFKDDNLDKTATETMDYLKNKLFKLSKDYETDIARDIVAIRYAMYLNRYQQYVPTKIAVDVSDKTVAAIEENGELFQLIKIDVDSVRLYPEGEYFSHILGYTRPMDLEEFEVYQALEDYDYKANDLIGKTGLEKALELDLRGKNGEAVVEVDVTGKVVTQIPGSEIPAMPGSKVFTTLDRDLQRKTFDLVENQLKDIILMRLRGGNAKFNPVAVNELMAEMVRSNNISSSRIFRSQNTVYQQLVKDRVDLSDMVEEDYVSLDEYNKTVFLEFKKRFILMVQDGLFEHHELVFLMVEQGLFEISELERASLSSKELSALELLLGKIESLELRPYQTGVQPCTASVVVTHNQTGEILAAVSYPSYDSNEFSGNFNDSYYMKLLEDSSTPLINRAFSENRAPGSTFKLVTAFAGLEEGFLDKLSRTLDLYTFTAAGFPHANCNFKHGNENIVSAIEVSCNYFFYDLSYKMGNSVNGNKYESVELIDKYASMFGLKEKTGVEIEESTPSMFAYDKNNPEKPWYDGDTIRGAIGQADIKVSAANLAKYMATVANGGVRYKMNLVSKIENQASDSLKITEPKIELDLGLKEENIQLVQQGLLDVTSGSRGTARGVFDGFDVQVAGKTGTIEQQESKKDKNHTSFIAYAPFDEPQIAIAVYIPYGNYPGQPAAQITKNIISEYMGLGSEDNAYYLENYFLP